MCAQKSSEHPSRLFEDEFSLPQPAASSPPSEATVTGISATFDSFPDELKNEALHRLKYINWILITIETQPVLANAVALAPFDNQL